MYVVLNTDGDEVAQAPGLLEVQRSMPRLFPTHPGFSFSFLDTGLVVRQLGCPFPVAFILNTESDSALTFSGHIEQMGEPYKSHGVAWK